MEDPALRVPAPQPRQASGEASPGRPEFPGHQPSPSQHRPWRDGSGNFGHAVRTLTVRGKAAVTPHGVRGSALRTARLTLHFPEQAGSWPLTGSQGRVLCGCSRERLCHPILGHSPGQSPSAGIASAQLSMVDVWGSLHSAYFQTCGSD